MSLLSELKQKVIEGKIAREGGILATTVHYLKELADDGEQRVKIKALFEVLERHHIMGEVDKIALLKALSSQGLELVEKETISWA